MANNLIPTITHLDATQGTLIARGTIATSGSYPASGAGDVMSFADALGLPLPTDSVPLEVRIYEQPPAGTSASGYVWNWSKGTDQTNGKVQIFTTGTASGDPLNELGNVAYSGLSIAGLSFTAVFPKGGV